MDRGLIEKLAAHIVESVEQLRRHGKPERLHEDPVQFGFVVHALQTVQAAVDIAAVIVSERGLGEPAMCWYGRRR